MAHPPQPAHQWQQRRPWAAPRAPTAPVAHPPGPPRVRPAYRPRDRPSNASTHAEPADRRRRLPRRRCRKGPCPSERAPGRGPTGDPPPRKERTAMLPDLDTHAAALKLVRDLALTRRRTPSAAAGRRRAARSEPGGHHRRDGHTARTSPGPPAPVPPLGPPAGARLARARALPTMASGRRATTYRRNGTHGCSWGARFTEAQGPRASGGGRLRLPQHTSYGLVTDPEVSRQASAGSWWTPGSRCRSARRPSARGDEHANTAPVRRRRLCCRDRWAAHQDEPRRRGASMEPTPVTSAYCTKFGAGLTPG